MASQMRNKRLKLQVYACRHIVHFACHTAPVLHKFNMHFGLQIHNLHLHDLIKSLLTHFAKF